MIITISGSAKDTGKTSLTVYLIKKLLPCCAVKFSIHKDNPYGEGIFEEKEKSSLTDTARMKKGGANPVYWVRTDKALLEDRLREVIRLLPDEKDITTIIEGNSILEYIVPNYSIFIMNSTFEDFKESAWKALEKAGVILINGEVSSDIEFKCKNHNKNGRIIFSENNLSKAYKKILQDILKIYTNMRVKEI